MGKAVSIYIKLTADGEMVLQKPLSVYKLPTGEFFTNLGKDLTTFNLKMAELMKQNTIAKQ
jgi:hypothetical protein